MVFSVSPSVTIREVDATGTIPAIATPPAAIAGVFRWGPINERVFINSENQLVSVFGKPKTYIDSSNTEWTNHETFFAAADFLSYSNNLYVTRVVSTANTESLIASDTQFSAKYPGEIGNSLRVAYVTDHNGTNDYEEILLNPANITTTTDISFNTTTFTFNSTEDFLNYNDGLDTFDDIVGDIVRIGNNDVGYQDLKVASADVEFDGINTFTYVLIFETKYSLSELEYSNLTYTRKWGYSNQITIEPTLNAIHIVVIDEDGEITGVAGTVLERFENLSKTTGATLSDGTNNYYKDVITNQSAWVVVNSDDTLNSAAALKAYESLSGGSDGAGEVNISFGRLVQGYDLYRDSAEVDIGAIIQGKASSTNLPNYLISNIAENRKDCVVYISPTKADVVDPSNVQTKLNNIIAFRNGLQNSSYWFMDTGYKYRYDKYNDVYRWVPMNGDIAGIASRVQPWESPAGFKRGGVKNVVKLAYNPNKEHRDQLYGRDVNPVISQVGQGVILFGDKTGLGGVSAFNRINVRRLFIIVEKAIATTAASFLFDSNDAFTQTQFKNLVEPFLRDIQGKRGITDFRVISDGTINTPDVIDANIFRGNIFIKPARTINFIELTFVATRTGVEFDEIIGQNL